MATPPRSTARSTSNSPRPKELGGGGGAGNNPEQLFAAGYAACFIGAMKFVASQGGPKVPADASVTSTVGIGPRAAGGFGLDIDLAVSLPGIPRADAEALVAEGPPGMPLFQRHPRQRGCSPDGRVTTAPNGPPRRSAGRSRGSGCRARHAPARAKALLQRREAR